MSANDRGMQNLLTKNGNKNFNIIKVNIRMHDLDTDGLLANIQKECLVVGDLNAHHMTLQQGFELYTNMCNYEKN